MGEIRQREYPAVRSRWRWEWKRLYGFPGALIRPGDPAGRSRCYVQRGGIGPYNNPGCKLFGCYGLVAKTAALVTTGIQ